MSLLVDVHVPIAITHGLRLRGVNVLTAQEDGSDQVPDDKLLDRATELGRLLFTQDDDLLREATSRQRAGRTFSVVIYAHQLNVTIGQCIEQIALILSVRSGSMARASNISPAEVTHKLFQT